MCSFGVAHSIQDGDWSHVDLLFLHNLTAPCCLLSAGHQEAAETSVLEAHARAVPGALLERCRLLWERDKGHRAVMELQLAVQQMLDSGKRQTDVTVLCNLCNVIVLVAVSIAFEPHSRCSGVPHSSCCNSQCSRCLTAVNGAYLDGAL
jgi:hypothetical protein